MNKKFAKFDVTGLEAAIGEYTAIPRNERVWDEVFLEVFPNLLFAVGATRNRFLFTVMIHSVGECEKLTCVKIASLKPGWLESVLWELVGGLITSNFEQAMLFACNPANAVETRGVLDKYELSWNPPQENTQP